MCAPLSVVVVAAAVHDADFVAAAAADGEDSQPRGGPNSGPGSRGFAAAVDGPVGGVS